MPLSFATVRSWLKELPSADEAAISAALGRQSQLTKPLGALGRLEEAAVWLAGWQGRVRPELSDISLSIFAGNHGITAQNVSAFPSAVTAQMVANFKAGGGAANQLANLHGARLEVIAIELERPTLDFTEAPAMSEEECVEAINIGRSAAHRAGRDLYCIGEMGIGNTTSAAAIAAALMRGAPEDWVGVGTGVDEAGKARKVVAVRAALKRHGPMTDPLEILRCLGGREIAAMFGALVGAREKRIPVLLDGYVVGAAASVLHALNPDGLAHCLAGHVSAEPGHRRMLSVLGFRALLQLDMRLGEGSGALTALGLLKAAVATHNGMATFEEAQVSGRSD